MFARVILSHSSRAMDKILEYRIPDGMSVKTGDAVTVPFGVKNKPTQGYVVSVSASAEFAENRIKSIKSLSTMGRAFDENMLEVISFMRQKYLCTFTEAVNAVVPSGASVRSKEWIYPGKECELSGRKKEVYDTVAELGAVEYTALLNRFSYDSSQVIRELVQNGCLIREYSEKADVRNKTESLWERRLRSVRRHLR